MSYAVAHSIDFEYKLNFEFVFFKECSNNCSYLVLGEKCIIHVLCCHTLLIIFLEYESVGSTLL